MKIASWNVNGLRSVNKKGFGNWLETEKPDILCLQEIKLQESQLPKEFVNRSGYAFFNFAERPGYSGVAVFSKVRPLKIATKLGLKRFDSEGRVLILEFPKLNLLNLYMPHGGRGKENLSYKLECYEHLFKWLKRSKKKNLLLIGDFNIAHQEVDLARPKQNKKNIMFTREERDQVDKLLTFDFIDSFREFNDKPGDYTWWPYFADARERNLGWRIDYAFVSRELRPFLMGAFILQNVPGSDHCPIGIELK